MIRKSWSSFTSLGISVWFILCLFISPQVHSKYVYKSFQNSVYCCASSEIERPTSIGELKKIVRDAIAAGHTVKAVGSLHSQTDVICTDGVPIDMHGINYARDNEDGSATFGAGSELVDVLVFLEERGLTLIHVPAYGGITMGGAIGTGAHGSSLLHPTTLSDQVKSLTVIDGTGSIRNITDPEDLKAWRVHLGLLGIVVDVTLKVVPLFKMRVKNTLHSERILFDGTALSWAKNHDWFQLWWFPNFKEVVVSKGAYIDADVQGNASTNYIPDMPPLLAAASAQTLELLQITRSFAGEILIEGLTKRSLFARVLSKPPLLTEDGESLVNPAVGYAWRLQSNKCSDCPWNHGKGISLLPEESSMAFDIHKFSEVLTMMKNLFAKFPTSFYMTGAFVRFSRKSEAYMSLSSGRDSFSVEWVTQMRTNPFQTSKDGIWAYQAMQQSMSAQFDGRPHWGKNGLHYTSTKVIDLTWPKKDPFITAMERYDPNGVFLNKFGRRLKGLSNQMDKNPRVKRCALQDHCVCRKPSDCAPFQRCGRINGFNVCIDLLPLSVPPLNVSAIGDVLPILNVANILN